MRHIGPISRTAKIFQSLHSLSVWSLFDFEISDLKSEISNQQSSVARALACFMCAGNQMLTRTTAKSPLPKEILLKLEFQISNP